MNFLIDLFHSLSLIFVTIEIFQLVKRDKLYRKIQRDNLDIKDTSFYLPFYVLRLIYIPWMFFGLFSNLSIFYFALISLGLVKFLVIYSKNNLIINIYDFLNTLISCLILGSICYQALFQ
jgi:hypothetical protein